MSVINLASVDGQCFQKPNPGGVSLLFCVLNRNIEGSWPNEAVINDDGDLTALPILKTGVTWKQYAFPNGTASVDCDGNGDNAYQSFKHMIDFSMAGFSKELRKEIKKHLNAGSVWMEIGRAHV